MGKRKSRKAPPKRIQQKVPKVFDCPFCNHENSVECKLDHKTAIGVVHCRVCAANYQTQITYLMEPVDVYADWIDECERTNKNDNDVDQADQDEEEQVYANEEQYDEPHYRGALQTSNDEDDEDDEDE